MSKSQTSFIANLDLSCNRIRHLGGLMNLLGSSLVSLNLSFNQIEEIDSTSHSVCRLLKSLDMRNNALRQLDCLSSFPNIKDLYLSNNELSRVPEDLNQLAQVENIDVHSNRITSIDLGCFPSNFNGHIDLSNNLIHSIEDATGVKSSAALCLTWRSIDLSNNRLSSIPQEFFDSISRSVYHLDISNNLFTHLPKSLGNMVHLRSLYLHDNEIKNSDCVLHNLTCLEQLTIGNTSAFSSEQRRKGAKYSKTFAPTLKLNRLRFLKKLFLHNIENFERSIEFEAEKYEKRKSRIQEQSAAKKEHNKSHQFNSSGRKSLCILRELNIEGFQDTNNDFLVDLLSNCPNIEQLDISNVPRLAMYLMRYESISRIYLPFLKIFKSNDNSLGEISGHIFMYLDKLSRLDLRNNNLETLPEEIQSVKQLEHLDLSKNNLAKCPEVLWMTNLKYLDLSSNNLRLFIWQTICTIETLDLSNNELRSFINISKFVHLKKLILANNLIESLPFERIQQSTKLKHLDLSHNRIQSIELHFAPGKKKQNISLSHLDLSCNLIQKVPKGCISNLSKCLQFFSIEGNPFLIEDKSNTDEDYMTQILEKLVE